MKSKYPIEKIKQDYRSGMSLAQINKKYGISVSWAWRILNKEGIIRKEDRCSIKKWRKLVRVNGTRIFSVPSTMLREVGVNLEKNIYYNRKPEKEKIIYDFSNEKKAGWNKAIKSSPSSNTRLVTATKKMLGSIVNNPDSDLVGKLTVSDSKIELEVKEKAEFFSKNIHSN